MPAVRNYHQAAVTRVRELPMRLGFAVLIALAAAYATSPRLPTAWLIAVLASQSLNAASGLRAARDPEFQPSPAWEWRYLILTFVNSLVFTAITPWMWFHGGLEGPLIALVVLMGGVLNIGTQPDTGGRLLWFGCIPYVAVLGGLPILSGFVDPRARGVEMAFLDLGSMLYLFHVLRAVRRREDAARAVVSALDTANAERLRAEQASVAKSEFLTTMSHEIRTPLNGVLGMAQAMARDPMPDVQRSRLEVIQQSGGVLLTLLNDLLDIAKIEAGKLQLEPGIIDLEQMARQAQEAFAVLAGAKDITLAIETTPAASGAWHGDPTRVRQVFYNLLSNAVKFTERGWVNATLDVDAASRLVVRVGDTGPGVSPAQLDTLFERFVQADASTTRRFGGSGLGLAISRELARLMGGDISAESVEGRGSIFTFTLPLRRAEADAAPAAASAADPGALGALRVLVAEDNETNRLVLSTLLAQIDLDPHLVHDGAQALEAWQAGDWDLVLMDIQMPVMDGLEATRRMRAAERETGRARTPVVALTANAMAHHVAEYEAAGFDAVATKPIQFARLVEAINAAVAQASERAAA